MTEPTVITATQLLTERGTILKRIYKDKTHFIVEKDGLPVAALMPVEEYLALMEKREQ